MLQVDLSAVVCSSDLKDTGVIDYCQEEGRNRPMAESQLIFPEVAFTGSA